MNRALFTLILGVACFVSIRVWTPRYDHLLKSGALRVSRGEAVQFTQAAAREIGVDASHWRFAVDGQVNGRLRDAQATLDAPMLRAFSPTVLRVSAISPDSQQTLEAVLRDDGHPLELTLHRAHTSSSPAGVNDHELSERLLREYTGFDAQAYGLSIRGASTLEGFRTVWERFDPANQGVLLRFEVVQRNGHVVRVAHTSEISESTLNRPKGGIGERFGLVTAAVIYLWACVALTLWAFFAGLVQRTDHLKVGLAACWLGAVFLFLSIATGDAGNRVISGAADNPGSVTAATVAIYFSFIVPVLLCYGVFSAGFAVVPESERRFWVSMKLLSQGQFLARPVARDLSAGLMFGLGYPVLFLLPSVLGLTQDQLEYVRLGSLLSRFPVARMLDPTPQLAQIIPIALVLPWCLSRKRFRLLALVPAALLSFTAWVLAADVYRKSWVLSVVLALLCLLLSVLCYRTWGLLAAWVAPASGATVYGAVVLLNASPEAFQETGWTALLCWAGFTGLAAVVGWKGAEVSEEVVLQSMRPPAEGVSRSERERLRANFSVARRAQLDMLPAQAPRIPGFTLSASCQSALEVGGDLFDFLHFPSGELGLCVADVSGKGVPAALYMTMTKGMLAAAETEPADLRVVLSRLNQHLRAWGGKRTFVTMSLALLDVASGTIRHGRAGHNSPLLCRAGVATFLKPSGMGLGITGPAIFDRSLEIEELTLTPGDILVLYSDGLVECMNTHRELFGEDRLQACVERNTHLDAEALEQVILNEVRAFQGKAEAHDDLTIMVIRREPDPSSPSSSSLRYEGRNDTEKLSVH